MTGPCPWIYRLNGAYRGDTINRVACVLKCERSGSSSFDEVCKVWGTCSLSPIDNTSAIERPKMTSKLTIFASAFSTPVPKYIFKEYAFKIPFRQCHVRLPLQIFPQLTLRRPGGTLSSLTKTSTYICDASCCVFSLS
jgi:hypothetical protein